MNAPKPKPRRKRAGFSAIDRLCEAGQRRLRKLFAEGKTLAEIHQWMDWVFRLKASPSDIGDWWALRQTDRSTPHYQIGDDPEVG